MRTGLHTMIDFLLFTTPIFIVRALSRISCNTHSFLDLPLLSFSDMNSLPSVGSKKRTFRLDVEVNHTLIY